MKTYKFYADPGHGWLAVKRSELTSMGIIGKISHYSYQRGDTVYLEEDCDASLFINRKNELGEGFRFIESSTNISSEIRSYERFQLTAEER